MARVKNVFSDTSIVYNYIIAGDIVQSWLMVTT